MTPCFTITDCINLQQVHNTLFHWTTTWNISFNPDKCEYMTRFAKKGLIYAFDFATLKKHNFFCE